MANGPARHDTARARLRPGPIRPGTIGPLIIRAVPGRPTCRRSGPGHGTKAHLPCRAGPINTPARRAAAVLPIPPPAMPRRHRRHPLAACAALPRRRLQPVRPPPRRRPQLAQPLPRHRPQPVRSPPHRRPSAHGRRLATVRSPSCRRLAAVPSARRRLAAAPIHAAGKGDEVRTPDESRASRPPRGKEGGAGGALLLRGREGGAGAGRPSAAGREGVAQAPARRRRGGGRERRGEERGVELGFGDVYIHGLLGWSGRDFY